LLLGRRGKLLDLGVGKNDRGREYPPLAKGQKKKEIGWMVLSFISCFIPSREKVSRGDRGAKGGCRFVRILGGVAGGIKRYERLRSTTARRLNSLFKHEKKSCTAGEKLGVTKQRVVNLQKKG